MSSLTASSAADQPIEADYFSDEGYAESSNTSYASSIASEIRRGIEENGRTYPSYGKNEYGLPIDEAEQDRNDLQHCKFMLVLNDRLHLAPISDTPTDILDLGTGSGIWAIDMADAFPTAEVIGVDIAPVQPQWVPPNCAFEIDDVESDWLYRLDHFDFIHAREFLLAIRDWDRLIKQSFDHLKPGGWLELSSSLPQPGSDDNTIPENSAWVQFTDVFFDIGEAIGASGRAPLQWKSKLESAGFEEVKEHVFKIPCNAWPKDPRFKKIGALEMANLDKGAEALLIRGMTGVLGRSKEEAQVLFAKARQESQNLRMHGYIWL